LKLNLELSLIVLLPK